MGICGLALSVNENVHLKENKIVTPQMALIIFTYYAVTGGRELDLNMFNKEMHAFPYQ